MRVFFGACLRVGGLFCSHLYFRLSLGIFTEVISNRLS